MASSKEAMPAEIRTVRTCDKSDEAGMDILSARIVVTGRMSLIQQRYLCSEAGSAARDMGKFQCVGSAVVER
jgi:hypothetical protein